MKLFFLINIAGQEVVIMDFLDVAFISLLEVAKQVKEKLDFMERMFIRFI